MTHPPRTVVRYGEAPGDIQIQERPRRERLRQVYPHGGAVDERFQVAEPETHPLEPEAARETLAREVEGRAEKDQRRLIQLLGDAGRSADVLLEKEPEIG